LSHQGGQVRISPNPACLSVGLQNLFPAAVVGAELREPGDASLLLPEEAEYLGRAVPKRAQEFAAGRLCARRALAEFGVTDFPIRVASDRQPLWPEFLVGSITHTDGYCAAVVAERRRFSAIGIDCEIVGHVTPELWPQICVSAERLWLDSLALPERAAAVTLLFAAKEAFYKCQYPLVGEWLNFNDLCVTFLEWGAARGSFAVMPTRPIALSERAPLPVLGNYRRHERFASAGVFLPADASSAN
jgi:4'-phosphopantetheinyl transferase EntD